MPAPSRADPLPRDQLPKAFKAAKPTIYSESTRPSTSSSTSIRHIAWSPTGSAIATTSASHIRVWNPEKTSVKTSQELRGHVGSVERVAWNPTREAELASTGADGTVRVWDVRVGGGGTGKGQAVQEVKIGDGGLFITWHPSGREMLVGRRDEVLIPIDVRMGAVVNGSAGNDTSTQTLTPREGKKLASSQTNECCFSNSGREVFATTGEGAVKILDWPSMAPLWTLNGHTSAACSVRHSPSGAYVAVGGGDSLITLWDTTEWVCKRTLAEGLGTVHHLSFSFDGTYICGGSGSDKDAERGIEVYHVETGEVVHTIETQNAAGVVAWHPLRYALAYTGDPGGLRIIGVGGL